MKIYFINNALTLKIAKKIAQCDLEEKNILVIVNQNLKIDFDDGYWFVVGYNSKKKEYDRKKSIFFFV